MDNLNDDLRDVLAVGQFHVVPESTSIALFLTAVLCGAGMGRGNARRCDWMSQSGEQQSRSAT
jgi:hypothetical protein